MNNQRRTIINNGLVQYINHLVSVVSPITSAMVSAAYKNVIELNLFTLGSMAQRW